MEIAIHTLTVLPILGALIAAHEAGHYFAARAVGFAPTEFAVGIGPALAQNGVFTLRAIPIAGYVALPDEFESAQGWRKLLVVLAGPVASLAFGFALILLAARLIGPSDLGKDVWGSLTFVGVIAQGALSAIADFAAGDLSKAGGVLSMGEGQSTMTGNFGMVAGALLSAGMISVVLAVFNMVPLPLLDGGRALLILAEMALRRRIPSAVMMALIVPSAVIVLALMAFVNARDVWERL